MTRRVAVTGIGVVAPGGIGATAFWDLLAAGRTATRGITLFDPAQACEIGRNWLSKGANCPFIGQGAPVAVTHTLYGGKLVYQAP